MVSLGDAYCEAMNKRISESPSQVHKFFKKFKAQMSIETDHQFEHRMKNDKMKVFTTHPMLRDRERIDFFKILRFSHFVPKVTGAYTTKALLNANMAQMWQLWTQLSIDYV